MARVRIATIGLVLGGFLVMTAAASALTLGNTNMPSGSTVGSCSGGAFYVQAATDSSYLYSAPAGGGQITSWSTNTTGDTVSMPVTFLVLRPTGSSYTVVGVDNETFPSPLPASGVATFNLAQPITVAAGDLIGLYSTVTGYNCGFTNGTIAAAEVIGVGLATTPSVGAMYSTAVIQASSLINVGANLVQSDDVGVTGAATPSSITAGGAAEYAFTVTNHGPGSALITFTDAVPSGLKVLSTAAGSGTCSTIGPTVTCAIIGLPSGSTASVLIVVSAATAGSYPDAATVATPFTDPNPADNAAITTLTVSAAAVATSCKVVSLTGAPLSVAKTVIRALNCTLGKVSKKASNHVRKGNVISTSPGPGKTLTAGTKVNIFVSSGPPKRKGKK